MKLIQPNCRVQFTVQDFDFILHTLAHKLSTRECLIQLLADEASRDVILDDEALFRALLEQPHCLQISSRFYFYVLVRHVLRQSNLLDRTVADYVSEVLSAFAETSRAECVLPGQSQSLDYFFEMVAALQNADERTSFELRLHLGNRALFLAGVFPDRIRSRAEMRGFPDITYYEKLGRMQYHLAGRHRLAQRYNLDGVLITLSEKFQSTRRALNDLADRLISLGEPNDSFTTLLNPKKSFL